MAYKSMNINFYAFPSFIDQLSVLGLHVQVYVILLIDNIIICYHHLECIIIICISYLHTLQGMLTIVHRVCLHRSCFPAISLLPSSKYIRGIQEKGMAYSLIRQIPNENVGNRAHMLMCAVGETR